MSLFFVKMGKVELQKPVSKLVYSNQTRLKNKNFDTMEELRHFSPTNRHMRHVHILSEILVLYNADGHFKSGESISAMVIYKCL